MNLEVVGVSEQGARSGKILVLSQMRKGVFKIPVSYPCKKVLAKGACEDLYQGLR